jgi:DNA-binding transcriptional ArsR family regulator
VLLETPKSTTQLVALTGQGLGSVGRHLKILLGARVVQRRRAGRSVLYYRTAAGDALVAAQQEEDEARPGAGHPPGYPVSVSCAPGRACVTGAVAGQRP